MCPQRFPYVYSSGSGSSSSNSSSSITIQKAFDIFFPKKKNGEMMKACIAIIRITR